MYKIRYSRSYLSTKICMASYLRGSLVLGGLNLLCIVSIPAYGVQDTKAEANMRPFLRYVLAYLGGDKAYTPQRHEAVYTGPHRQYQPVTAAYPSRLLVFLVHHGAVSAEQRSMTDWGNQRGQGKHIYRIVQKDCFMGPIYAKVSYFTMQGSLEAFDVPLFAYHMYHNMMDASIVCDGNAKTHTTKCLVRMQPRVDTDVKIYGISLGCTPRTSPVTQNVCFVFRGDAPKAKAYLKMDTDQGTTQQFRTVYPAIHDQVPLDHTYAQKGC